MTAIDIEWLKTADAKELEDENELLGDEILSITHQLELAAEFPEGYEKSWELKAKFAKARKVADREKVRRRIREYRQDLHNRTQEKRDRMFIRFLRTQLGEAAFLALADQFKALITDEEEAA